MNMWSSAFVCTILLLLVRNSLTTPSTKRTYREPTEEHRCDRNLRIATGGTWERLDIEKVGQLTNAATKKLGEGKKMSTMKMKSPYHVKPCNPKDKYRTADGSCNNLDNPQWGQADTPQLRFVDSAYDDGISVPRFRNGNRTLPSARLVSTTVHPNDDENTLSNHLTHMVMQFGQFLDHDITLTPIAEEGGLSVMCCVDDLSKKKQKTTTQADLNRRPECFPIPIPKGDRHFKKPCMNFVRSVQGPNLQFTTGPAEQMNAITAYIDASQVYGANEKEQDELRSFSKGKLQTSRNDLLPATEDDQLCNRFTQQEFCFKAGDERVNEQPALATMHTIFMREHNRIAEELAAINPEWNDEKIFQETRKIVGALMQHIAFTEDVPTIIGEFRAKKLGLIPKKRGYDTVYDKTVDASIRNEFSTAAFRYGHTLVRQLFSRLFGTFERDTKLSQMFFRPGFVSEDGGEGVNRFLKGLTTDQSQSGDKSFTTELTDRLFEEKGGHSFDLVALNIQRGRDHGIPSYNAARRFCGLSPAMAFKSGRGGFSDHEPNGVSRLSMVYSDPDDVDLFSGAMTEKTVTNGVVGPTFACIIGKQFQALKFGDRFYYENDLPNTGFTLAQLNTIKRMTLAKIICENSSLKKIQPDVFSVETAYKNSRVDCSELHSLDLNAWKDGVTPFDQSGTTTPPSTTKQHWFNWHPWSPRWRQNSRRIWFPIRRNRYWKSRN